MHVQSYSAVEPHIERLGQDRGPGSVVLGGQLSLHLWGDGELVDRVRDIIINPPPAGAAIKFQSWVCFLSVTHMCTTNHREEWHVT